MLIQVRFDSLRDTYFIGVESDDQHYEMPVSNEAIYQTDPETLNRHISEKIGYASGVESRDILYALNYLVRWIPRRDAPPEWEYRTGVSVPVSCRQVEERSPFTEQDYRQLREQFISMSPLLIPYTFSPGRLTPVYENDRILPNRDNRARLYRDSQINFQYVVGNLRSETISFSGFFAN